MSRLSHKIIISTGIICTVVLMAGLIVQANLLDAERMYYRAALSYCMEHDCTQADTEVIKGEPTEKSVDQPANVPTTDSLPN